ncbi:MAG: glycosyltransferase family 4 protein, partial [Victivallaceae bacterium]|nr:glycosyltransferase family 4 protein [Victivallaceae bacterium]
MKIAIVHNEYGKFSGEEAVVRDQIELLKSQGHEVVTFIRSSVEISNMFFGKIQAFLCGIYNPFAVRAFREFLKQKQPDIIHIHNLFPLISPAILPECKKAGIPVVMTVHNYRLICPNGLFMNSGGICEKCSGGKEWNCVKYNCENSRLKSFGYALRNRFARFKRYYLDNVDIFAVLTEFQRQKLIKNNFPEKKIIVLANMNVDIDKVKKSINQGDYVAYAGRLSKEKGIDLIIAAAAKLPRIKFKLAGSGAEQFRDNAPANLEFCGYLSGDELDDFYSNCRFAVMASTWYEGFPITLLDAMACGKTVIVPDIGGLPEIEGGITFPPGNISVFTEKIKELWDNPE